MIDVAFMTDTEISPMGKVLRKLKAEKVEAVRVTLRIQDFTVAQVPVASAPAAPTQPMPVVACVKVIAVSFSEFECDTWEFVQNTDQGIMRVYVNGLDICHIVVPSPLLPARV